MSDVTFFTNVRCCVHARQRQGTVVTMEDFEIDGVDEACFNFPENTVATLKEGTIKNMAPTVSRGAVPSSTTQVPPLVLCTLRT